MVLAVLKVDPVDGASTAKRVVFPAPLGPRSPKSSPFFMARLRLSMALMEIV